MRAKRVRLDTEGKFVEEKEFHHSKMNANLADILAGEGIAMVTITFDDGRETLWSKVVEMKKSRPIPTVPLNG